ncbi:adenine-specific DNA-methyltransferase [Desulfofustis glycolicus DSM 9705]|uniref:site-specific DNA-methyltransferase (adenine-specific) n=2 Tax=Desulfofustis glycolicus TaxID=51195 RepID=A0A1M5W1B2_9BACT|nr:site-specific DNA-methyltransferase [Desulfofustis glycolicus]SHH81218.1 adenine-specific DNA-methyltransferase [Desulfofustis glycolicus DSM 9705]
MIGGIGQFGMVIYKNGHDAFFTKVTVMEKLKMHSPNLTQENIARIRELFPDCVTEGQGEGGQLRLAVDFDQLRQELSESIVEGPQERYHLNWPGKREALLTANAPIARTLRPCREESVYFDTTKNLFIEGDNLEALKLLQETYLGKVKMIYIDPPYNTGNDFIYEDDFAENAKEFLIRSNQKDEEGNRLIANTEANGRFHSDWLSMIYPRLRLARNLLRDDGLIFISIDDGEVHNLRKVLDEIFGEQNFVAVNVWKKSYGGGAKSKHVIVLHEYVMMYAKCKDNLGTIVLPPDDGVLKYYKFKDEKFNFRGPYRKQPLATNSMDERPNLRFPIKWRGLEIWPEKQWQWSKKRVDNALEQDELVFTQKKGGWTVDYKQYLKDEDGQIRGSKMFSICEGPYTQAGTGEINEMFGNGKIFSFPKPSKLIKHFVQITSSNDVILDFFAGSSPTAHAVMQLNAEDGGNRRFIMAQLPELCDEKSEAFKANYKNIAEISKERIRRSGKKILEGECHEGWKKDIGFRVLKIDSSNMTDVYYKPDAIEQGQLKLYSDNIKPDRKPEDLLFQVLLDWGVDLSLPIRKETIQGKTVFFVNEPPYDLVACFDTSVNEDLVKELARFEPLRVVFRDTGFVSDAVKINVEQIFKQLSPGTEVKSI